MMFSVHWQFQAKLPQISYTMKKKFTCTAVWRYRQRLNANCFVVTCKLFFTFCMLILQGWTAVIHEVCDLKTLMLSMYFICIFGGAFLVNTDTGYYSSISWKWRETWTHVPTNLGLADPVENWRDWVRDYGVQVKWQAGAERSELPCGFIRVY